MGRGFDFVSVFHLFFYFDRMDMVDVFRFRFVLIVRFFLSGCFVTIFSGVFDFSDSCSVDCYFENSDGFVFEEFSELLRKKVFSNTLKITHIFRYYID